jgi:hypothetical protein
MGEGEDYRRGISEGVSMSDELAREIIRSMREERSRRKAPDHGWIVDLLCRRDDGLEVMQDCDAPYAIRIQSDSFAKVHIKTVRLQPTWFSAASALLREMKALHREKASMEAHAALKTLRST